MKITVLACAAALTGCAKTDSMDLLSTGIYASLSATATGNGTTDVRATLFVGDPINLNYVDLTGDDRLVASNGSTEKVMTEIVLLNLVAHHADFPIDAEGAEFQISFERSIDRGAPNSFASLPAKFDIASPFNPNFSRAAEFSIAWSGISTDDMRYQISGTCIDTVAATLPTDEGSLSLPAGTIKKRTPGMNETVADQCPMDIELVRSRPGTLDRGYGKGGSIYGAQSRKLTLMSVP
jgi:hypothetical protein